MKKKAKPDDITFNKSFIGRKEELNRLTLLRQKQTSSFVTLRGRRRIGKSTLIQEFSQQFSHFFQIQGLSPHEFSSNSEQLRHFATRLSLHFNTKLELFMDWSEAFHSLAQKTKKGDWLILLDEISWMGKFDPRFSTKLKESWDIEFKTNAKLCLIVCGSVSHWIEEHMIKNQAYEGRLSLDMILQELSLPEIEEFWKVRNLHMGSLEKMLILSVTGGVPKYLEEILSSESAQNNLLRLCFKPGEFLFEEYDKIFTEIFERKSKTIEKIVRQIHDKKLTPVTLAKTLNTDISSSFSENLRILELAGFICRDYLFNPNGSDSRKSKIRLKDNYLRFYLKYIEPLKKKILKGNKKIVSLYDLPQFESTLGYQFENLILANVSLVLKKLKINESEIRSAAPFFQAKSTKNKGSCQIDLLIHTNLDVFYMCEFKCKKRITDEVIKEVKVKMNLIKLPKRSSLKPVLVYEGEMTEEMNEKAVQFFYRTIHFSELLCPDLDSSHSGSKTQ